MKIFLSSTYLDLIEHRKAVVNALRTMDEDIGNMEVFGARDEEATTVSLTELDKCDVLVGVYAYRYGTVPAGSNVSVTEQEYLHAMSKKIPILVFVVNESYPWFPKFIDKNLTQVEEFKTRTTKEHTPDYFTSPDNLAAKVVASIGRMAKRLSPKTTTASTLPIPYYSPKPIGSTLPSQPFFFGRTKELEIIADAISPESRTWGALIDGPGGIGKTALAIRAAHLAPEFLFERKIFISAKVRELTSEGEKPLTEFMHTDYLSMINELALELGEDNIPRLAPDERSDAIRLALSNKKILIVFDNLETLLESERSRLFQILGRLPQGNKAIVTSRRRADIDARVVRLDRLESSEALLLISELAKGNSKLARASERERRDLYEITNGNPLFIRWITGQLGREGSQCQTIADAYSFLERAPKGNDPLEYIFGDLLETFSEHETSVLAALTHYTKPAKLSWIANMVGIAEKACETALDDLADRSILISNAELREFYLPPLAAQFIKTRRIEAVKQTGGKLANRVYALAMQFGGDSSNRDDFNKLDSEWISITAALPNILNEDNTRLQRFVSSIFQYLNFSGKWDELVDINERAEQKAQLTGDKINAGWRAYQAGWVYNLRAQAFKVLTCATRAETHWQSAGVREKSMATRLKGMGHELENNFDAAILAYREVLDLRRVVNSQSDDVAIALYDLASAERKSGNFAAAENHYREAYQIDRKNNSQEGIAMYMSNLAVLALDKKQWIEAERLARNSLELGEKLGRKELIANNCSSIARAVFYLDRPTESLTYARRALTIYTDLSSPDQKIAQEIIIQCEMAIEEEKKKQEEERKKKRRVE